MEQQVRHVFVDGSGHEITPTPDNGKKNDPEYRVTMTTFWVDGEGTITFKHWVA